jgi:hypothetical protein
MGFQIEVINVKQDTKPTAKGSYTVLDVAYKRLDTGKIEGKKIMSFTNKEVFGALSTATNGSMFNVEAQKNEQSGYWDWVKVQQANPSSTTVANVPRAGTPTPKSTYETPEERALRQRMIVRQSSLSNAIETLKTDKVSPKVEEVLSVAKIYFDWVMEKEQEKVPDFSDMQDDIPL